MPDIARIGSVFAERRLGLRLTQQTLADLAGVSRSSVQALERGGSINFGSVLEIAEALGLHIEARAGAETTIRVSAQTRDLLAVQARERDISIAGLLAELAADSERTAIFRAERDTTRAEAAESAARDELADWETTVGDGIA